MVHQMVPPASSDDLSGSSVTGTMSRRRPGRARPTVPVRSSQSQGAHTVNWASVEP